MNRSKRNARSVLALMACCFRSLQPLDGAIVCIFSSVLAKAILKVKKHFDQERIVPTAT